MNDLQITEEAKLAFLDDIDSVEKKHKLQLCAILHRTELQQVSKTEAVLGIRQLPCPSDASTAEQK